LKLFTDMGAFFRELLGLEMAARNASYSLILWGRIA